MSGENNLIGKYTLEKINENTFRIDEYERDCCYLLLGKEKAMLIDTTIGTGDLSGLIRSITDLPIIVVATHAHGDHAGGAGQFSKIYIHKAECNPFFYYCNTTKVRAELFSKKMVFAGLTEDCLESVEKTEVIPMSEGDIFDLGERIIEVIYTPGHSPGSVTFLDKSEKMMFTGDTVCKALWLKIPCALSVEEWLPSAERILSLADEFVPFSAHDDGRLTKESIQRIVTLGKEILQKYPVNSEEREKICYPEFSKEGCIFFDSAKVHKKK